MVNLVILACLFRATTKKGRQLFGEKVHPRENHGYAYGVGFLHVIKLPFETCDTIIRDRKMVISGGFHPRRVPHFPDFSL